MQITAPHVKIIKHPTDTLFTVFKTECPSNSLLPRQKGYLIWLLQPFIFQALENHVKDLEQERDFLTAEVKRYRDMTQNQIIEVNQLRRENLELKEELTESEDLVKKLKTLNDELVEEKQKAVEGLSEKDKEIENLKEEMKSIIKTLAERTKMFYEKETETENIITALREHISALTNQLETHENYIQNLESKIKELNLQIERLKHKLKDDRRFKMFVDIKREVNDLKEQNEELQYRVEKEVTLSMPMMTSSGKMTSPKIRSLSGGTCRSNSSSRPKSSSRGKSASAKKITIEDLPGRLDVSDKIAYWLNRKKWNALETEKSNGRYLAHY